jgi:formate dehydrogenase iron-sulfur subunit
MKDYAILLDTTYCTGCNTCTYRCIQEFRDHDAAARGVFRNFVQLKDAGLYDQRCMQCKEPQCVKACPSGALTKSGYGPVLYEAAKCTGDKHCVGACPFQGVQFDETKKKIVKCTMCAHRVSEGKLPACVEVCPSGALQFGEYSEMVTLANTLAAKGKLKVYGLQENGGTHVIILTRVDPVALGYPKVGKRQARSAKLATDLAGLPLVAGAVYVGLRKLSDRKTSVELSEGRDNAK